MFRKMGIWAVTLSFALSSLAFAAKTEKLTYAVSTKGEWSGKASKALTGAKGVNKTDVMAKASRVQVEIDPSKTSPGAVANALSGAGVDGRLLVRVDGMR